MPYKNSVQQAASHRNHSATFGSAFFKVVGAGLVAEIPSRCSYIPKAI